MVDRIKDLCNKKGITIAELERACGIGNGIIARWRKSKPSFERVAKVAKYLDVSPEYLLMGEKEKPASTLTSGFEEKYNLLSGENKKIIDDLVAKLLKSQSSQ